MPSITNNILQRISRASAFLLTAISISVLCFFIIFNANWILGDDVFFLGTTAIGKFIDFRSFVFPETGRFLPLQLWDYNILKLLKLESAFSHYALVSISFFCLSVATFFFYKRLISQNKNTYLTYWLVAFATIFLSTSVMSTMV